MGDRAHPLVVLEGTEEILQLTTQQIGKVQAAIQQTQIRLQLQLQLICQYQGQAHQQRTLKEKALLMCLS